MIFQILLIPWLFYFWGTVCNSKKFCHQIFLHLLLTLNDETPSMYWSSEGVYSLTLLFQGQNMYYEGVPLPKLLLSAAWWVSNINLKEPSIDSSKKWNVKFQILLMPWLFYFRGTICITKESRRQSCCFPRPDESLTWTSKSPVLTRHPCV